MYGRSAGKFRTLSATAAELVIADADTYVAKSLGPNSIIKSEDGASATVKDIIYNGNNWVIQLTNIKGKLQANQGWTFNQQQKVVDLGGNKSLNHKSIF
jgi:hypothetical protein